MKVSIITAVFNGASSVARTLQSVAEQDHPQIEHIVVDGASQDPTLAIVAANDKRIATIISEPDNGPYDAFNKGLRCATGDAIAFLNSGDTYASANSVSRLVNLLETSGTQAVFADVLIVDTVDSSRVVRRYSSKRFSLKKWRSV